MLEPSPLVGHRIVAEPRQLDALRDTLSAPAWMLRFAPDEALVVGLTSVALDDPDAIVEDEAAFATVIVERVVVERHTEWVLPAAGQIGQGAIAGVPAKLAWLPDGRAWVITHAAYVDELLDRLR